MKRSQSGKLMVLATERTGSVRKAMQVVRHLNEWAICQAYLDRDDFTVPEMLPLIGKSQAQVYKDVARFKEVFPDHTQAQVVAHQPMIRRTAAAVAAGMRAADPTPPPELSDIEVLRLGGAG